MKQVTRALTTLLSMLLLHSATLWADGYSDENDALELPFQPTRIVNGHFAEGTQWYSIRMAGGKHWYVKDGKVQVNTSIDYSTNEFLFCFVGDNVNGFCIYNRQLGTRYILTCASDITHEPFVPVLQSEAPEPQGFKISQNADGFNFYYPGNKNACLNDLRGNGTIALWTNAGAPTGVGCRMFFEPTEPSEPDPDPLPNHEEEEELHIIKGPVSYFHMTDGTVIGFPHAYLASMEEADGWTLTDNGGTVYRYEAEQVERVTQERPEGLPHIESFKFNNKFNDTMPVDAEGEIRDDSLITIRVGGIGKRLVPSIKVSHPDAELFIGQDRQESKVTSQRFEKPLLYTVARPGYQVLRKLGEGEYALQPMGHDYVVKVEYQSARPTTEYGIPIVRIYTNDGTMISSKDRYWDATIEIDGAGFYPDMAVTPMQIKGRGNSSWKGTWGKSPYRIKFEEKQKPLGLTKGKSWVLLANYNSESMLSNAISMRIAEMVGTAGANHIIPVELYINGDYRGSYNLTEKVGLANNSIDMEDETNALLLELDSYYDETYKFRTTSYSVPTNIKFPDFANDETNLTFADVRQSFNQVITNLAVEHELSNNFDPVYAARYLMVNDMIGNMELMHPKSTYLHRFNLNDEEDKFILGPVWDCDWTFGYEGSNRYFTTSAPMDYYTVSSFAAKRFIYDLRYSGEEMNKQYYRVWTDFIQNHLPELKEYVMDYYEVAAKSFDHDHSKWRRGNAQDYKAQVDRALPWLERRANWVYDFLSDRLGYADMGYLDPDDDTGIPELPATLPSRTTMPGIYDLHGRKIADSSRLSDLKHPLQKGIYIIDGRRTIVR